MEDKKKYVYQLSLSDGRVLIYESEGLFSVNSLDDPEDKTLINVAVLIRIETEDDTTVSDASEESIAQAVEVVEQSENQ